VLWFTIEILHWLGGYIVSAQTGGLEPVMFAVVSMLHK